MHNPNYSGHQEQQPPNEHDIVQLNEYYKEDPTVPGDPDEPVIEAIVEEEERSNANGRNNSEKANSNKVDETTEKVAPPPRKSTPKQRRKKIYFLLFGILLAFIIILVAVLIFFRLENFSIRNNSENYETENLTTTTINMGNSTITTDTSPKASTIISTNSTG